MTHGEAWYANKRKIMQGKKLDDDIDKHPLPPRMSRAEARAYYNTKLFRYWLQQLPKTYPLKMRKKMLRYLMFRNGKAALNEVISYQRKTDEATPTHQ